MPPVQTTPDISALAHEHLERVLREQRGGPWELPRMQTEAKFDWRLALMPIKDDARNIRASSLGGYDYVIPKGAKDVEGAFRFIEFMSRADILKHEPQP